MGKAVCTEWEQGCETLSSGRASVTYELAAAMGICTGSVSTPPGLAIRPSGLSLNDGGGGMCGCHSLSSLEHGLLFQKTKFGSQYPVVGSSQPPVTTAAGGGPGIRLPSLLTPLTPTTHTRAQTHS